MNNPGTQTLTTRRLTLRRFTPDDMDAVYENWASDPIVTRYLTWETHPDREVTRAVVDTWVAQYAEPGVYNWLIELDGTPVGAIAVVSSSAQDEHAEIGYALGRRWWGQGIMTEALGRVLAFLFEKVGLRRVYLRYDVQNAGSGRVMAKNGLREEGVLREHRRRKDGTFGDERYYGILRDEWLARNTKEASHGNP